MKGAIFRFWERACRREGVVGAVLHACLLPLSVLYGFGVRVSLARRRKMPAWKRRVPVVLVGNITVGGTGKTPLVADITARLAGAGRKPVVVSRGWGGKRPSAGPVAVSEGGRILLEAAEAGDEPWLLARTLGASAPVVVGKDRVAAAELAVDRLGATAVVLDDGYQQRGRFPGGWRLVAVNAAEPLGNGALFPAGTLREHPSALLEAHAIVLTHADEVGSTEAERAVALVSGLAPDAVVAWAAHRFELLTDLAGGEERPPEWLRGKRVLALSAIGYPRGFERMLAVATGEAVPCLRAPDHYAWTGADIMEAAAAAVREGCAAVVTTAKDAARFPCEPPAGPAFLVARMKMVFLRGEDKLDGSLRAYLGSFAS